MPDTGKMTANYHSHTWRCMHADGTERMYIECAIESGFRVWGFSDHTPQPYPPGRVSRIRMTMGQLEDYVTTVLDLKREYRSDIDIHLGLEVEYFPAYFDKLLQAVEEYPIEYFLLGQHFIDTEFGGTYSGRATGDPEVLRAYCRIASEALETGRFAAFAHPDLIYFTGDPGVYEAEIRALCRKAKACRVPLELNFLGLCEGRNYPSPAFWRIAAEEGNQVIWGLDAHDVSHIGNRNTLEAAAALTERLGLERTERIDMTRLSGGTRQEQAPSAPHIF